MKQILKTALLFVLFCSCKTQNLLVNNEKNNNNQHFSRFLCLNTNKPITSFWVWGDNYKQFDCELR